MIKVDIIGGGNVATHLEKAFLGKTDAHRVSSRTLEALRPDADVYMISVSDDAIREVAGKIKKWISPTAIVAHTSGSTPLGVLKGISKHTGVFYPLQTFSKDVALDYSEIPFFIEGESEATEKTLSDLARIISKKVTKADSEKRRDLHIASVFCCNFCNHLWALGDDYLERHGLDFSMLLPLIKETARKASQHRPVEIQTGPAVRNDNKVLEEHFRSLETEPELQDLYSLLTLSIKNLHAAAKMKRAAVDKKKPSKKKAK